MIGPATPLRDGLDQDCCPQPPCPAGPNWACHPSPLQQTRIGPAAPPGTLLSSCTSIPFSVSSWLTCGCWSCPGGASREEELACHCCCSLAGLCLKSSGGLVAMAGRVGSCSLLAAPGQQQQPQVCQGIWGNGDL